jgi:hypothetical protein
MALTHSGKLLILRSTKWANGLFRAPEIPFVAVGTPVDPTPPSRPGEFHPEPLTEPCVTVSSHTARAIH